MLNVIEARHHARETETLRTELIGHYESLAVRNAIGTERASSLSDIAQGAGIIALGGRQANVYKKYGMPAQNGVYLALHSQEMGGSTFRIPYEQSQHEWAIPSATESSGDIARHVISRTLPGMHVITASLGRNPHDTASNIAKLTHEITHVKQTRAYPVWAYDASLRQQAANEAEAYNTQFRVHDVLLDGALSLVIKDSIQYGDVLSESKRLVIPDGIVLPDGRNRLTEWEVGSVLTGALHQVYGYSLATPDRVSDELFTHYAKRGQLQSYS